MDFFSKGLKNEFETAVVNELSVFEPLKVYCIWTDGSAKQIVQTCLTEWAFYGFPGKNCFFQANDDDWFRCPKFYIFYGKQKKKRNYLWTDWFSVVYTL